MVVSPDHDLFLEQLDGINPDLSGLRFGDGFGSLPVGLVGRDIYAFQPRPTGAALSGLPWERGGLLAASKRQARGLSAAPGGALVSGGAVAPLVVPGPRLGAVREGGELDEAPREDFVRPGGVWLLDELGRSTR